MIIQIIVTILAMGINVRPPVLNYNTQYIKRMHHCFPDLLGGIGKVGGLKGDQGSKGEPGEIGMKGYAGHEGPKGPPGLPGQKGSNSGSSGIPQDKQAAFSVTRTKEDPPTNDRPLGFDTSLVNINADFSLDAGKFNCKIPGVYYFVFHAMSSQNICVRLRSDQLADSLNFCDYNSRRNKQALSGGTVLQLSAGQKVWLEPFKGHHDKTSAAKSKDRFFVFSGFLISPTA